eukprot:6445627-Amphidinium_carterae.1
MAGMSGSAGAQVPIREPHLVHGSPEEAWAKSAASTRLKVFDHMLKSGCIGVLLAVAERTVVAIRERGAM